MSKVRSLKWEEIELISKMLRLGPKGNEFLHSLEECQVEEMQDGGMGSLRFVDQVNYRPCFGRQISEAEFYDEDGILVSAALNLDQRDQLFELDLWKVDFSPLKRYPKPEDVQVKPF